MIYLKKIIRKLDKYIKVTSNNISKNIKDIKKLLRKVYLPKIQTNFSANKKNFKLTEIYCQN